MHKKCMDSWFFNIQYLSLLFYSQIAIASISSLVHLYRESSYYIVQYINCLFWLLFLHTTRDRGQQTFFKKKSYYVKLFPIFQFKFLKTNLSNINLLCNLTKFPNILTNKKTKQNNKPILTIIQISSTFSSDQHCSLLQFFLLLH